MSRAGRSTLYFDAYHLPGDVDLLYRNGAVVPLEPRAVAVLRYLASHHDRVVAKNELLEQVWSDVFTTDGVLKKAISQIRKALQDSSTKARYIETYHGRGYRFLAPVRRVDPAAKRRDTLPPPSAPSAAPAEFLPKYEQFKGREAQLAQLCAEFESARSGNARPVVISGDAGIGKTQLARHFRRWAREHGATTVYARFFDYRGAPAGPFEMFLDLLASALDTTGDLRKEIEWRCGVVLPPELFGDSSRVTSAPVTDRSRFVVPLARCFLTRARSGPLVVVLDDLQWADDVSLEIIGCMMRLLENEQLMLVLLVRSEEERSGAVEAWLGEHAVRRSYSTLRLHGLDENAYRQIAGGVFNARRSGEIPQRDIEHLHRLTEGNPYFLMEVLRVLVAEKAVISDAAQRRWIWKGIESLSLPESVVLASRRRIERLSSAVYDLVEQASVLGDEFRIATLSHVSGRSEQEIEPLLADAMRAGILSIHNLSRGEDCRFQHSIQRHVLYASIPPHRKRRLHAAAAQAIETVYAGNPERIAETLSAHYAGAGDDRRTFEWSLRAWNLASRRSEWRKAALLIDRAEEAASNAQPADQERAMLLVARGETFLAAGRIHEAVSVLQRARAIASVAGDRVSMARAWMLQGHAEVTLSDYARASASLLTALDQFRTLGDHEGSCRAVLQLAAVENARGHCASAEGLVKHVLGSEPPEDAAAMAKGILGWSLALRGELTEARSLLEEALAFCDVTGNLWERSMLLRRLHWIDLTRGDYESAIALAARARADSIAIGDALGEAKANFSIGQTRIAQGLYEEGVAILGRTLERLQVIGDAHCEAEVLWLLGRAKCESGDLVAAASLIPRALEMVRKIGDRDDEYRILIDLSRLEVARQNLPAAREAANAAHTIADELKNSEGSALAVLQIACVDFASGDANAAVSKAESAVALLEQMGSSERWRGYSILGLARRVAGDRAAARVALERSVALVDAIREQIQPADVERRTAIARNRSAPARDLVNLLVAEGLEDEAVRVRRTSLLR
jgi:DNA-binding winged helix-turn-helix (wHTH) protein/tetratricopeptide (TPR) repeat protein